MYPYLAAVYGFQISFMDLSLRKYIVFVKTCLLRVQVQANLRLLVSAYFYYYWVNNNLLRIFLSILTCLSHKYLAIIYLIAKLGCRHWTDFLFFQFHHIRGNTL